MNKDLFNEPIVSKEELEIKKLNEQVIKLQKEQTKIDIDNEMKLGKFELKSRLISVLETNMEAVQIVLKNWDTNFVLSIIQAVNEYKENDKEAVREIKILLRDHSAEKMKELKKELERLRDIYNKPVYEQEERNETRRN